MAIRPIIGWIKRHKIAGFVLAVLVLAIVFTAVKIFSPRENKGVALQNAQVFPQTKDNRPLSDEDNDGLQLWEETLYGTDPKNADTDGDGTPDGEEVRVERGPLTPGRQLSDGLWSDALESIRTSTSNGSKNQASGDPDNLTESLGNLFLSTYLGAATGGTAPGPEELPQVVDLFLTTSRGKTAFPTIKPGQIKTIDDASPDELKNYLNVVADILSRNLADVPDSLTILAGIIQTEDASTLNSDNAELSAKLRRFDLIIAAYRNTLFALLQTPVPHQWKHHHQKFLNLTLQQIETTTAFRNMDKDAVKMLLMVEPHYRSLLATQSLLQEVRAEIARSGLKFAAGDPAKRVFGL